MSVYYPFGTRIICQEEFMHRVNGLVDEPFFTLPGVAAIDGTGSFRPFADVGFGKPLSILIRKVYTGRYPEKSVFSNSKPLLISSSIKDVSTTSAAAQALNLLKKRVSPRSVFSGPSAGEEGTSLVYYSPAIASSLITITLQMVFQDFDHELFDRASRLFAGLAGVPIFIPAAGYLLGASTLLKLSGNVGSQIRNGHPVLKEDLDLDFSFGGGAIPIPGFWILTPARLDAGSYQFDPHKGLTHKSDSRPYDGDDPVVVLSVDGQIHAGLVNFTPLMASSTVLGRIFNQNEGSEVAMDSLLNAVRLFSDLSYRKRAEEIKDKISLLREGDREREKLESEFTTLNANIGESRLRLC